jgi:hypothetical protein
VESSACQLCYAVCRCPCACALRALLPPRGHAQAGRLPGSGTGCTASLHFLRDPPVDGPQREAEAVQRGDCAPEVQACAGARRSLDELLAPACKPCCVRAAAATPVGWGSASPAHCGRATAAAGQPTEAAGGLTGDCEAGGGEADHQGPRKRRRQLACTHRGCIVRWLPSLQVQRAGYASCNP